MNITAELEKIGIFKKGKESKTKMVFDKLYNDILTKPLNKASEFIDNHWSIYEASAYNERDLNGKIFEALIAVLLYRCNIRPMYQQATLAFVPNAQFDIITYTQDFGILSFSIKTSLRERDKQADLEAFALKSVHRNSKSYLITLSKKEAINVNKKIEASEMLGLEKVILATSSEFDNFIETIQSYKYEKPGQFSIVSKSGTHTS